MIIEVENLDFSYRTDPILKDILFNVRPGSVLGIVGPNGSGKTTLIKCINRILIPKGTVYIDKNDLAAIKQVDIAKTIGYVPQSGEKIPGLSVVEVLLMGRLPHMGWRTQTEDLEIVSKAIDMLDIRSLSDKNFNELSGGQQQKVLIARALCQTPQILLLDEPTSSLDIRHQLEVMEIIRKLVDTADLTAVITIHDLSLAARYSDNLIILKEGKIIAGGSPDALITADLIREVYGVEAQIVRSDENCPYIIPIRTY